jgi:15-cis-phytoene synthase/lycopene beta-cyclase
VAGFRTDLAFSDGFPIDSEDDLALYSSRVAGTIAELCLALVYHHDAASRVSGQASEARQRATTSTSGARRSAMILASRRMGIALQYVNIVRDVATDAQLGRVYLPTQWLLAEGSSPTQVVQCPRGDVVRRLRIRLLAKAFAAHDEAVSAMASLPCTARVPLRVAVESYMEIGRVLQEELANDAGQDMPKQRRRRATVPLWRRLAVAWRVLRRSD